MNEALARQLREDRALRDAARALFQADVAHLRADLAERSISERIVDRIGEGASDVLEEAMEVADNNKGVIATLVAAIVLWFARNPILGIFADDRGNPDAGDDDAEEPERNIDHAR